MTCLDITADHLLLSGSEDKTARLWDVRDESRRRACLCIAAPAEVFSVTFAPNVPDDTQKLSSPFAKDHSVYVSEVRARQ